MHFFREYFNPLVTTSVITSEFAQLNRNYIAIDNIHPAEAIIEYSARLCYNSNDKFGTNPNFIKGLIKAGHLDVLEHAAAVFRFDIEHNTDDSIYENLFYWQQQNPYLYFHTMNLSPYSLRLFVCGNLRAFLEWQWQENMYKNPLSEFLHRKIDIGLYVIAPNIFSLSETEQNTYTYKSLQDKYEKIVLAQQDEREHLVRNLEKNSNNDIIYAYTDTGAEVIPIGYMPVFTGLNQFRHTSYLLRHVSRAFSHQHVRHRLFSISQMSQRYVDYSKQGDDFIYPPELPEGSNTRQKLDRHFAEVRQTYQWLRSTGIKKEDARIILPNAAETHLVFSSFAKGLDHYIKLRTASDAQYEIRKVAELVQKHERRMHQWDI